MNKISLTVASLLAGALLFSSCVPLMSLVGMGGYNNAGMVTVVMAQGQFRVELIECVGNAGSQSVTAVLAITNMGPNDHLYIGGNANGSLAIDSYGSTSKPYSSAGKHHDLPSGVVVRVEVDNINPVRPGTPVFQTLRVSIGSGQGNIADFRNVPIVWTH